MFGSDPGPNLAFQPRGVAKIENMCFRSRGVTNFAPKCLKLKRCRKMKVLERPTIFTDEKSSYFHGLVLKGRRSPYPSGGILTCGYGAAWESKF